MPTLVCWIVRLAAWHLRWWMRLSKTLPIEDKVLLHVQLNALDGVVNALESRKAVD